MRTPLLLERREVLAGHQEALPGERGARLEQRVPPTGGHEPQARSAPAAPAPAAPAAFTREWLAQAIDGRVAVAVGLAWMVLLGLASAIEPRPSESGALVGTLLGLSLDGLLLGMLVGLSLRRRWGLAFALAGGVLATAAAIACPVSGHHRLGAWWFGQMACMTALVALSAVSLARCRDCSPR